MKDVRIATIVMVALLLMVGCFDDAQTIMKPVLSDNNPVEPIQTMGEMKAESLDIQTTVDEPVQTEQTAIVEPPLTAPVSSNGLIDLFTHEYHDDQGIPLVGYLPMSAWIVNFPGPYREHTPPKSSANDFVGQVCMEIRGDADPGWAASRWVAPVSDVVVTITHGPRTGEQTITDEGGYYLLPDVSGDELCLRVEKPYLEPQEVIVSRTEMTKPQELKPNEVAFTPFWEDDVAYIPGVILVGLQWPDLVRPILENELLPSSLFCIIGVEEAGRRAGSYGGGEVMLINDPEKRNWVDYDTLIHEIAHARQHADAIIHGADEGNMGFRWEKTPEGKAYQKAWDKDMKEAPGELYLVDDHEHYTSTVKENNAEYCSQYWTLLSGSSLYHSDHRNPVEGFKKRAPNRFKWAQTYLNVHP